MLSSPLGPVQQVFNAMPAAAEKVHEQVAQCGYAKRRLPAWSFFLPVRAGWRAPRGPASQV
jgi:hypothetical protein